MADDNALSRPHRDDERQPESGGSDSVSERIRRLVEEELDKRLQIQVDPESQLKVTEGLSIELRHGPIPPPSDLREYQLIDPTLPQQIMDRSLREQGFRHEMMREQASQERVAVADAGVARNRGQLFAFIIAMTAIIAGAIRGEALAAIISTLAALSGLFIATKVIERWPAKIDQHPGGDNTSPPDTTDEAS